MKSEIINNKEDNKDEIEKKEDDSKYIKSFNKNIVQFIHELNLSFPEFTINIELVNDSNIVDIYYTNIVNDILSLLSDNDIKHDIIIYDYY